MKRLNAIVGVALGSILTGWLTGQLWKLGNWASELEIWWFVALALVTNLAAAAAYYYLLRGAVHFADGGFGFLLLLMPINLLVSLGVAASVAGAIGAGTAVKMGSHAFLWGMSYAYGQAIHDVRRDTWLHD